MRVAIPVRPLRPVMLALALLAAVAPAAGQEPPAAPAQAGHDDVLPILTLDRERLFSSTLFGQAVIARFEAEAKALQAENRRIDAALEAEERALTERRTTSSPDEFRALSVDFDSRVEKLRSAQDAKSRDLTQQRDAARQQFYDTALPVLGKLMSDLGAVAIIDRGALIISFERIDITDEAIARIDEVLGDGSPAPAELTPEPAPESLAPESPAPAPQAPDTAP